ncbi:hypothetical protein XELAEV_18029888mg [Xenopus laevis]|uniref:Uncharacterized protein n=1 Tax=Xenopus laevis TaxID=8355 RepID=A0A974HI81_XENLA|nr:hypothetical protein XELAEV_18029888mg [Xenopus laevis]
MLWVLPLDMLLPGLSTLGTALRTGRHGLSRRRDAVFYIFMLNRNRLGGFSSGHCQPWAHSDGHSDGKKKLVYINDSYVSEGNTPILPVYDNSAYYCYSLNLLSFSGVTVPLRKHLHDCCNSIQTAVTKIT